MTDDWLCFDRAREGDEAAWQMLYEKYYPSLVRIAYFITGSLDSAHDVGQEAFVSLLHVKVKHREASFKSLLTTIAYRLALKERMRKQPLKELDAIPLADDAPSLLERVVRDETNRLIVNVIQSLAVEYREVMALRFFGEHSYEEIARIMEMPIGTVKSRIFYAVKSCREKLKELGVFE